MRSVLLAALAATRASAADRYLIVDNRVGDDAHDGLTGATPLRTIAAAACRAVENESEGRGSSAAGGKPAGWTLAMRGGVYPSLSEDDVRCFGVGVPLTLQPHAGEPVLMSGGVRIESSAFKKGEKNGQLTTSLPTAGLAVSTQTTQESPVLYGHFEHVFCGCVAGLVRRAHGRGL